MCSINIKLIRDIKFFIGMLVFYLMMMCGACEVDVCQSILNHTEICQGVKHNEAAP